MNFHHILKHRWLIFLFLCILTFLCAIGMPALAKLYSVSANTQVAKLNNTQKFQANGQYRQACQSLVEELGITDFNCRQLINEEISSNKIQRVLNNLPVSPPQVSKLTNLGELLRLLGVLNSSEAVLTRTLELSQKLEDPELISQVYLSLGNTQRAFGERAKFLKENFEISFDNSLQSYQKSINLSTSQLLQLRAKNNLFNLIVEDYFQENIIPIWQEIQLEINELPVSIETIYLRLDFAQTLALLNLKLRENNIEAKFASPLEQFVNHQKDQNLPTLSVKPEFNDIIKFVAQSVQKAESLKNSRLLSYTLGNLAELYEINQQWKSAKQLTEKALKIAQSIQAEDITYRLQWQLGRLSYKLNGNNPEAIQAYNEAFETLQSLRKDLASINRDIQFSFRDEVEPMYRQFVEILLEPQQPSQDDLQLARQVIEGLQLAEIDNFFREACVRTKEVTIDKVDSQAAVIYPIILSDQLEVIVSFPNSFVLRYQIPIPKKSIIHSIDVLQTSLYESPIAYTKEGILSEAQKIYQWLIEPAAPYLESNKIETLVFVLDGAFRNIPMAVLHDGHQYLIEKYQLALTPGLQLLDPKKIPQETIKILAAGRSKFQDLPPIPGLNNLDEVPDELNKISQQLPAQQLLNEAFTKVAIQKQINSAQFPIVHIATHGNFSSKAEDTYLVLWNEQVNVNELDTLLRINDFTQKQEMQLLVLSACQTATGDERAALGMAGVALKAGARTTLATLWNVQDESTAQVMVRFYQELKNPNINKAEALRRAQLVLLNSEEHQFQNPHYWAPFVLIGNWL